MKKRISLLLGIGCLAIAIGITIFYFSHERSRKVTFQQCTDSGGVAWTVNLYHVDICPACDEYLACERDSQGASNIHDECPQVLACNECVLANWPYPDTCPDGREKVGEISDAAIWFLCCR